MDDAFIIREATRDDLPAMERLLCQGFYPVPRDELIAALPDAPEIVSFRARATGRVERLA